MEFKEFPEIKRIGKIYVTVTQKIHGTNAAVYISDDGKVTAAKRGSFCYPEDDNFGFARFVDENKQAFIDLLGPGVWHGEWAGPGINSGEGLIEKTFCLFDVMRLKDKPLPPRCVLVPVLYEGPLDQLKLDEVKAKLLAEGSRLVPGYPTPEGVVMHFAGTPLRIKDVFKPEESAWTNKKDKGPRPPAEPGPDLSHLLQPIRLEKLMSRDESLKRGWPENFGTVMKLYVADLEKEGQLDPDPDHAKAQKKGLGKQLAAFLRDQLGV